MASESNTQRQSAGDYRRLELTQLRESSRLADDAVARCAADVAACEGLRRGVTARIDALNRLRADLAAVATDIATEEDALKRQLAEAEAHAARQTALRDASEAKMRQFEQQREATVDAKQDPKPPGASDGQDDHEGHDNVANVTEDSVFREPAPLPPGAAGPAWIGHASPAWARGRPRMVAWGHPPRTLYGVGTTFLEYVAQHNESAISSGQLDAVWTVVPEPSAASVVWMRDHLVDFERDQWDPLTQQLNRANVRLEQALGNKANLARAMEAFYRNRTASAPRYTPLTFPFGTPQDFIAFLSAAQQPATRKVLQSNVWILKRADLASGFGIELVPDALKWFDAEKLRLMEHVKSGRSFVLQQYVRRPRLIDGRKFDFRLYVFFTTMYGPTVRALATDGYVRLSVEPYADGDYGNQRIHVSNVAAGRTSEAYTRLGYDFFVRPMAERAPDPRAAAGAHPLKLPSDSDDWAAIRRRVDEAVSHVVRAVMLGQGGTVAPLEATDVFASQLYGFDFTIDDGGHPWLTEVQVCPALGIERDAPAVFMEVLELLWERLAKRRHGGESLEVFHNARRFAPLQLQLS